MNDKKNIHLGKKILYAVVIALSGLLVLLSVAGIIAVWLVEGPVSDAAVAALRVVENSAGMVRASNTRVDQTLADLQAVTTDISDASQQLSQNVTDKGLVLVLLPEEREQELVETANSVLDTFDGIRQSILTGVELYRSIDRIPFVNLPALDKEQVQKIETSVANTQALAENLRLEIANFRSGVTGVIDKVEAAVSQLNEEIGQVRDRLAQLDASLAALEALSIRLQQLVRTVLITLAILLTLVLAFLIFTQVEVIRLYLVRWRSLGQSPGSPPDDLPAQPVHKEEISPESE